MGAVGAGLTGTNIRRMISTSKLFDLHAAGREGALSLERRNYTKKGDAKGLSQLSGGYKDSLAAL